MARNIQAGRVARRGPARPGRSGRRIAGPRRARGRMSALGWPKPIGPGRDAPTASPCAPQCACPYQPPATVRARPLGALRRSEGLAPGPSDRAVEAWPCASTGASMRGRRQLAASVGRSTEGTRRGAPGVRGSPSRLGATAVPGWRGLARTRPSGPPSRTHRPTRCFPRGTARKRVRHLSGHEWRRSEY